MNKKYSSNAGIQYDADAVVVLCKCLTFDNINISTKNDVIDSIEIKKGDIIALGGQTDNSQNGIYVSTGVHLVRHPLFNNETNMLSHIAVVTNGTYKNYRLYISVVGTVINVGLGEIMGGSTGDVIATTREEFFILKNAISLKAGNWYLITDFAQTFNMLDMPFNVLERGTPTIEPMLVFATSASTVDSQIKSLTYPQDAITWNPDYYNENDFSYWSPVSNSLTYRLHTAATPSSGSIVLDIFGTIITITAASFSTATPIRMQLRTELGMDDITVTHVAQGGDPVGTRRYDIVFPSYTGTGTMSIVTCDFIQSGVPVVPDLVKTVSPLTEGYPSNYQGVITHRHDKELNNQAPYDFRNITFRHWPVTAPEYEGSANVQATNVFSINDPLVYPSDGDTITIGTEVYEFDSNSAVTPGNIAMPFIDTYVPQEVLITFSAVPDAGTWGPFEEGLAPFPLAYNADAAAIQTYLRSVSTYLADATVTGDYTVGFTVKCINYPKGDDMTFYNTSALTLSAVPVTITVTDVVEHSSWPSDSNELVEIIGNTVASTSVVVIPSVTGTDITFTAVAIGSAGNGIATTTTTAFGSFATATLEGGIDAVQPSFVKDDIRLDPTDNTIYLCMRDIAASTFPSADPTTWVPMFPDGSPISSSINPYWTGLIKDPAIYVDLLTFGSGCSNNTINYTTYDYPITATGNVFGSNCTGNVINSSAFGIYFGDNNSYNTMLKDCNQSVLFTANHGNTITSATCCLFSDNVNNIIYNSPVILGWYNNSNTFTNSHSYCSYGNSYNSVIDGNHVFGLANAHNTLSTSNIISLLIDNFYITIQRSNAITLSSCSNQYFNQANNYLLSDCHNWIVYSGSVGTLNDDYTLTQVSNITIGVNCNLAGVDFSSATIIFNSDIKKTIYYDATFAESRIRYMDNGLWVNAALND